MNPVIKSFLLNKLDGAVEYKDGIKAKCFFHSEVTPSFFVYYSSEVNEWFYNCFGCNSSDRRKSGSLYKLIRLLNGPLQNIQKPKYAPVRKSEEKEEVAYYDDITVGMGSDYQFYRGRGVSDVISDLFRFKVVYGPEPAAVMPVYTHHRYVGYVKRYLNPGMKYKYELQSGCDFSKALWGYDRCDKSKPTIVTEGILDAACWWSEGIQAVALIGKKWGHKLDLIKTLENVYYLPDNGDPESFQTFRELQKEHRGWVIFIPRKFKDSSEYKSAGGSLKKLLLTFYPTLDSVLTHPEYLNSSTVVVTVPTLAECSATLNGLQ